MARLNTIKNDLSEDINITEPKAVPETITDSKDTENLTETKPKKIRAKVTKPKELPPDFNKENAVMIDGEWIEIKPTAFRYFRNRTANIYDIFRIIPLTEFFSYEKGTFDNERDSDEIMFDFLVAVFDDKDFVKKNYDKIDAETFDRIIEIFGRINKIEEKKEAQRKNREAQAQKKA